MTILAYSGTLTVCTCWCGIRVGVPNELYLHAKEDPKNAIYCPLGHSFVYRESDASRLRRQLEAERENSNWWRNRANTSDRRLSAAKGQNTKLRKRITAGVCPCCNRSFAQLARHIKGQHPDYAMSTPDDA